MWHGPVTAARGGAGELAPVMQADKSDSKIRP